MFGFKRMTKFPERSLSERIPPPPMIRNKLSQVDEKLLEEKCLNILRSHFEKWIQNTYEALSFEQLECVSKYAKEVYNMDDEEFAKIITTRPSKYFPVRETPIPAPPTSRGKRREMKVCDDACLMDKKEMDSIIRKSKNNHETCRLLDIEITQNNETRLYNILDTKGGSIELVNQDLEAFNDMTFPSIEYMLGVLQEKVNTKELDKFELSYRVWRYEKDFKI